MLTRSPPPPTAEDNSGPVPASAHIAADPPRALPAPHSSLSPPSTSLAEQAPPLAAEPPALLPDVFSRISAALSSRAVPRCQSPPRGRKRP